MILATFSLPPMVQFEDDHLLVINKPAGWNTHAPSPYAGEGVYDWLRHREPRWATLAIMHRLDKETSGVLVFARSPEANRSLTAQFAERSVRKQYLLVTDSESLRGRHPEPFVVVSTILRAGDRYVSGPLRSDGERAETRFRVLESAPRRVLVEAEPVTGRTHQIRVHAAAHGFPILGDTLYGGTPAARMHLHAVSLTLRHPATGEELTFSAAPDFSADPRLALRRALLSAAAANERTDAFRLFHGAADGWPGWYVDCLGPYLLSQSDQPLTEAQRRALTTEFEGADDPRAVGAYHKRLNRRVRQASVAQASPQRVWGESAPARFEVVENGVRFELSFEEGYSTGLFLDQRDNRRRFLTSHVAAEFPLGQSNALSPGQGTPGRMAVLNTFAYTCGFSVCAALAGAHTTSVDLSRKYLDWGRRHFELNGLDPAGHEFLEGDTFDWLRRLAKKGRRFEVVVLDPPTFSQAKASGVFRADRDYGKLVRAALAVLKEGGVLLASTNAATFTPEAFVEAVEAAVQAAGRTISRRHYVPQPPDFPITREEPGYLKTFWLRVK